MFSSTLWTMVLTGSLACVITTLGIKIISPFMSRSRSVALPIY
jgi:hypothetical protein